MGDVYFDNFVFSRYKHALVVTDPYIAELYGIAGDNVFLLPRGEQAKSFDNVAALCRWFLSKQLTPAGLVVAVGGGSVGDTVGFACSIFKRGIRLLHVPTTLIAMVDSAIGGKTAIDLDGVKNAVGSYFFNFDTLIDPDFLHTLDEEQLKSGAGEILKYRMLNKEIDNCVTNGENLQSVIAACVRFKQEICAEDPYCRGKRNALNFGHTIGHAMELALGLYHGCAVANGIYYETKLAASLGLCSKQYTSTWCGETEKSFSISPLTEKILDLTLQDKKNKEGSVAFALPTTFDLTYLPLDSLKELLLY